MIIQCVYTTVPIIDYMLYISRIMTCTCLLCLCVMLCMELAMARVAVSQSSVPSVTTPVVTGTPNNQPPPSPQYLLQIYISNIWNETKLLWLQTTNNSWYRYALNCYYFFNNFSMLLLILLFTFLLWITTFSSFLLFFLMNADDLWMLQDTIAIIFIYLMPGKVYLQYVLLE